MNKITEQEYSEARSLAEKIQMENGYLAVRVLPDASIAAICDLMFTRSIVLGVSETGYASRFCFEDHLLAIQRFWELSSEDDEPQGFIARRPELRNPDGSYMGAKK